MIFHVDLQKALPKPFGLDLITGNPKHCTSDLQKVVTNLQCAYHLDGDRGEQLPCMVLAFLRNV